MSANKKSKKYGIWSWVVALYGPIIFWTLLINLPKVEWEYVFESNKTRVARHHEKAKEIIDQEASKGNLFRPRHDRIGFA